MSRAAHDRDLTEAYLERNAAKKDAKAPSYAAHEKEQGDNAHKKNISEKSILILKGK